MDLIVSLFRALANELRLRMFATVHARPGITVSDLGVQLGVPDFLISQHLRVLADMGLLDARPSGRFVHVHPPPATSVRSGLVSSVSQCLAPLLVADRDGNLTPDQVWDSGQHPTCDAAPSVFARLIFLFTAYTHLRRLLLLRCLAQKGPTPRDTLTEEIGMSSAAAARQLSKLERRGLVTRTQGTGGTWELVASPGTPAQQALHCLVMDVLVPAPQERNLTPGQV